MANRRITDLNSISTIANSDKLVVVDVSDTTGSASGTSKQMTLSQLTTFLDVGDRITGMTYNDTSDILRIDTTLGSFTTTIVNSIDNKKLLVSSTDTTEGYLEDKILGSPILNVTKNNPSANEQIKLDVSFSGVSTTSYDAADYAIIEDTSASNAVRKVLLGDIAGQDTFITSGGYSESTGVLVLLNNTGGTVNISGFTTADVFVTGGTFDGTKITLTNNTGGTATITGMTDVYLTGGTFDYTNQELKLYNTVGQVFSVYGFADNNTFVTGGTLDVSANTFTFTNSTGGTFNVVGASDNYTTGATLSTNTAYFDRTSALSAYTLDLSKLDNADTGVLYTPNTWTNNGDGTISLPQVEVVLHDNQNWTGNTQQYTISSGTSGTEFAALTDNDTNYIYVDYNGGSPTYVVTTAEPNYFRSDYAKYLTLYRVGNFLHVLDWDNEGSGLANKLLQRAYSTKFIERESGLALSLSGGTNIAVIGAGVAWNGVNRTSTLEVNSTDDTFFTNYHSGGTWVYDTTGNTINNTYYDDGTNLVSLSSNRYVVNWFYRGIETAGHLYQVVGSAEYTSVANAQLETAPAVPELISSHAILVGRVIIQESATGGIVESAFEQAFTPSTVTNHNDLSGLQGGTGSEYYHLTSDEYNAVNGATTPSASNVFLTQNEQFWSAATGTNSIAVKNLNGTASGSSATSIGLACNAGGNASLAAGSVTTANGVGAFSVGAGSQAIGNYSVAEGNNTTASGSGSHSEGTATIAATTSSHAEGQTTQVTGGTAGHAEGIQTIVGGSGAHAGGIQTQALADGSFTFGLLNVSTGQHAIVGGNANTTAADLSAIIASDSSTINASSTSSAIIGGYSNSVNASKIRSVIVGGANNVMDANRSIILGGSAITATTDDTVYGINFDASNYFSGGTNLSDIFVTVVSTNTFWSAGTGTNAVVAKGHNSVATGEHAVAIGSTSSAETNYSFATGSDNAIKGVPSNDTNCLVGGSNNTINGAASSFAHGSGNNVTGDTSAAFGSGNNAGGVTTFVAGQGNKSIGFQTAAFGTNNIASGNQAFVINNNNEATGSWAFAAGSGNFATNTSAVAFGSNNTASANSSFVHGSNNTVSGSSAVAFGQSSTAGGTTSFTTGSGNKALGFASVALCNSNTVEGSNSLAGGASNTIESAANNSFAIGASNTVKGTNAVAFGAGNTAGGDLSHVGGTSSNASGLTSFVHATNSTAVADHSVILGGVNNDVLTGSTGSTIFGGQHNQVNASVENAAIIGCSNTTATTSNTTYMCNVDASGNIYSGGTNLLDIFSTGVAGGGSSSGVTNGTLVLSRDGTALQASNDTIYLQRFIAPRNMTVAQLGGPVGATSGTDTFLWGIYTADLTQKLVQSTGSTASLGHVKNTAVEVSAGDADLTGGTEYWAAFKGSNGSASTLGKTVLSNSTYNRSFYDAGTDLPSSLTGATSASIRVEINLYE